MNKVLLYIFLYGLSDSAQASHYMKYSLAVGQSIILNVPFEGDLKLSQKNIIDIQNIDNEQWRLIALKPGSVTIRPRNQDDKDQLLVLVQVSKAANNLVNSKYGASNKIKLELILQQMQDSDSKMYGVNPELGRLTYKDIHSSHVVNNGVVESRAQMDVILGKKIILHDGGEFKIEYDTNKADEEKNGWKEYGVRVEAIVHDNYSKDQYVIDYNVSIKSKSELYEHLQSQKFASVTYLKSGDYYCVGWSQLKASFQAKSTIYFIENIPIIGPLFRMIKKDDALSKMFVWLRIN